MIDFFIINDCLPHLFINGCANIHLAEKILKQMAVYQQSSHRSLLYGDRLAETIDEIS
jgi:hypothetical protein